MSQTLALVRKLTGAGEIKISSHGYDELAADHVFVHDIISSVNNARVVEDYPDFGKGPCVLVLQHDRESKPLHVVWGVPKGHEKPAVLVTAYRPDPKKWSDDYLRRKK
jgi:Domain of unknown function (DUF4258)